MENQVFKIAVILWAVIVIAVMGSASFAQSVSSQSVTGNRQQMIETLRLQLLQEGGPSVLSTVKKSDGQSVSTASKASFATGSWFAFAIWDFSSGSFQKPEFTNAAVADMVYLIDSLEGQPEAVTLQKTLRSFVRRTSSAEQIIREIQNSSASYAARLGAEQKWYFSSGVVVTDLILDAAYQNSGAVMEGVSKTQGLIKSAPKGTAPEVLEMLGAIVKFTSRTSLTQADYEAIGKGAFGIINIISA